MKYKRKKQHLKKKVLLRIANKKFERKVRSRLKKHFARGGRVSKFHKRKYRLTWSSRVRTKRLFGQKELEIYPIEVPEVFDFIEKPVETTKFLMNIKNILNKRKPRNYHISHEKTKKIGLAASFIFDKFIDEEVLHWRRGGIKIYFSGKISASKEVNNFLLSYGILNELGIKPSSFSPDRFDFDYKEKYVTIKLKGSNKREYYKSVASVGLVEYFNTCFNHNGLEITESAKGYLIDSFGEIIGNAEEHCGVENSEWYVLGCYKKNEHNCSFAIINFGNTVYESLSNEDSTAAEVILNIQNIVNKHKPILEQMHGKITPELIEPFWNVMALQDGISSRRVESGTGRTRGQGMMDVLSFIDSVKPEEKGATICLLSGHSAIVVDYEYPIFLRKVGPEKEERRTITFNKKKDLHQMPDKEKVMFVKDKFGGTIFTGSFRIDEKHLLKKTEARDEKGN